MAIGAMTPSTTATDIASYSATGLPSGLGIDAGTGVVSGTPDTADPNTASAAVTVTDTAGNTVDVSITFPAVAKGAQTLTGFAYSSASVAFSGTAPAVTAPGGIQTTLSYSATPTTVCTVDSSTGALTLVGVGACEITATAASSADYNEATAAFTVTVQAAGALALNLDAIATDNTVNIAEKAAGFAISGDTGSEAGVSVTVTVGGTELTATSAAAGAWSVDVPANAAYLTGASVAVTVSASKTGLTSPGDVMRTLAVDLTAPAASYTAPGTLQVGVAIGAMTPSTTATDIAEYSATGLPPGLGIDTGTGVIGGTPDTADPNTASAAVTVTDTAGNTVDVSITFPAVAKGAQTLTGFAYSSASVTFSGTAPAVTAPGGVQTTLSYSATPSAVCTVDSSTGALTLVGVGACNITATAAGTANYNEATAAFTVTVQAAGALALNLDAIATDNTVNIAEKAAGFTISGDTGSEAGVSVTVTVGGTELTATSAAGGAWSVDVPANAAYITGASVAVTVSASKTGLTSPSDVMRTLAVDLTAPAASYTAPSTLQVGVAIGAMTPSTTATDIAEYSATGLPPGLGIDTGAGVISGTPDTADANTADATVTVTDTAGNPATVSITFPAVANDDTEAPDANMAPSFSSSDTFTPVENQTTVGTVAASDDDMDDDITDYALSGGADQALFAIDGTNGALTFLTAPDYEEPQDADADNAYLVTVQATSGTGDREQTGTQTITVTVMDANEQPDTPAKPTVSAVSGSSTTLTATWTEPGRNGGPEITGYEVRYQSRANATDAWSAVVDWTHTDTATTTTITGLTANTDYQVQVKALNGETPSAWSDYSDAVSTVTQTMAEEPEDRLQEINCAMDRLDGESDARCNGIADSVTGSNVNLVALQFQVMGQLPPGKYDFYDLVGWQTLYKMEDGRVIITKDGDAWTEDLTPARAPRDLEAKATGEGIVLSWQAPKAASDEVTGYRVLRRRPEEGEPVLRVVAADTGGTATAWTDTGVEEGVRYTYRVMAVRGRELSGVSNARSLRGVAMDDSGPEEPALTASFEGLPEAHDGESAFRFRVAFSEDIGIGDQSLRDDSFTVSGGEVTGARRVDGRHDLWQITVAPDSDPDVTITLPAGRECEVSGAICTRGENRRRLSNSLSATVAGPADDPERNTAAAGAPAIGGTPQVGEELSASTSGISDADGLDNASFAYQWIRADTDIQGATGSTYTPVAADAGERLEVRVSFTDDAGHEERLTSAATDAVAAAPEPLTASFEDMPAEHAGQGSFSFRVAFSDEINISYKTVRDASFTVTAGEVTQASRVDGRRDLWEITVEPDSDGDVAITLPETTDCDASGAICTSAGRPLSHALSATVAGPVGIAVADARVDENAGAPLAFAVTLSRAASAALTVDYATADGSAHAGDDYTAASGTLTFGAGESSQTIEVAVLDDAHDEGEETLTLTLSNASSGRLTDGEATGTIANHDSMPRALLARFGRTAAVHVVEHVEERLAAPREPGFRGRFAGRELRRGMERVVALDFLRQLGGAAGAGAMGARANGPLSGAPAAGTAPFGMPGPAGGGRLAAASGPMGMATGPMGGAPGAMGMAAGPLDGGFNGDGLLRMGLGGGDVLTGSDFALGRETRHGGILSIWSRGAQSRFSGREGALSLDGDVRTTMVGADYAKGPLVTGLSLSHSRSLGEYAGVAGGQVASSVTGLYPWLGYKATERVTVWGVAGYGSGGLLLTPQGGPALASGLAMAMAAAGTRGELVSGGAGGFALAFKADALWVGTSIDGVDGPAGRLKATGTAVTRFRTGLEGSRAFTLAGRLSLKPSVEVGLRHDGGDADTGAGMDIGGGLVVSESSTGLAVDLRVRMLVMHQAEGFRERGMAVTLSYNPRPSTPLGFTARVAPSWGGQATSGAEALWGRQTMAGLAPGGVASGNRLDGEVGYGLPVGSRFVGRPRVGFSTSEHGRDYRVGYGLGLLNRESLSFELGIDAQRRESPRLGGASNGAVGRGTLGW